MHQQFLEEDVVLHGLDGSGSGAGADANISAKNVVPSDFGGNGGIGHGGYSSGGGAGNPNGISVLLNNEKSDETTGKSKGTGRTNYCFW